MNKDDLIKKVSKKTNYSDKIVREVTDNIFRTIMQEVKGGEKLQVMGFGTFELRQRNERQGRNPHTGETLTIPAKTVPFFKPGTEFKQAQ